MSEYQYYEFVAIDHALSSKQQVDLRAVSSRGRITASSFVNEYEWGDLKADPATWMEQYFDAHLYWADWGARRIMLRLPTSVLAPQIPAMFCVGESATFWATRTHVVLDLASDDEEGDEEWLDEEQLAAIVPARAELAAGDHRLLYLAWLSCVQNQELDDDVREPSVPAGLTTLSAPLRSLADFLRLDADLLAVAAEASRPQTRESSGETRRTVGDLLAAAEQRRSGRR